MLATSIPFSVNPSYVKAAMHEVVYPPVLPVHDTTINGSSKDAADGAGKRLNNRTNRLTSDSSKYESYMMFELDQSLEEKTVKSAILHLYLSQPVTVAAGNATEIGVYRLADKAADNWTEGTLTWNKANSDLGALGDRLGGFTVQVGDTSGKEYTVDVTGYVQEHMNDLSSDNKITLVTRSESENNVNIAFVSKDETSTQFTNAKPSLNITTNEPERTAMPTISPAAGTYINSVSVSLGHETVGAAVYYTTDGSKPTMASPVYTGMPILIDRTTTIKAVAAEPDNLISEVKQSAFTIQAAAPTADVEPGTYMEAQNVALHTTTPGASIRYTTDGSEPAAGNPLYEAPVPISASATTLKAKAFKDGLQESAAAEFHYIIDPTVYYRSTVSVKPSEDTYINKFDPDANFKSDNRLDVRSSGGGAIHSYLKFKLDDASLLDQGQMPMDGAEIESAVLKVYLRNVPGGGAASEFSTIGAFALLNNHWSEDWLTFTGAESGGFLSFVNHPLGAAVNIGRQQQVRELYSFDVTEHIRNMYAAEDKTASLVLSSKDNKNLRYGFYSSNDTANGGAFAPKLEITVKSLIASPKQLTAKRGDGKALLKWAPVEGADAYEVKRGTVSGTYTMTVNGIAGNEYLDTGLTNGTAYYYAVSAYNSEHHSLQSQQISIVPQKPTAPAAPKSFSVAPGDKAAVLDWDAVPEVNHFINEVQGYKVYRKAPGEADFRLLATITETAYTDLNVVNQQQYFYKVAAYNEYGEGATEMRYAVPRKAADYQILKSVSEDGRVQLHWQAVAGAQSYKVLRSAISGMGYVTIADNLTELTFIDNDVTNSVEYYYALEVTQADQTGISNEVLAIPEKFDVNIARHMPSEASSIENFGVEGSKAFDGIRAATNRWASRTPLQDPSMTPEEANDQWLWVDLGKQKPVGTIVINWDTAYAKSYDILVSNDKVNWTAVVEKRDVNLNPWVSVLRLDEQVLARYVKFQGIARGTAYGYSIYEMEIFTPQMNYDPMEWVAGPPENVAFKNAYASNQQTYLSWDPARGVSRYSIKRKAEDEEQFKTIATDMKARVYWDYGLENDRTYTYILVAINDNGAAESEPISLTPYVQYNARLDYTPADYNTKANGYLGISLPANWRPFSPDSLWNTPIGPNPALDVNSTKVVEEIARYTRAQPVNKFKITFDEWAIPVHVVNADKVPPSAIISANAFDFADWNQDRTPDIKVPIPVNAFREPTEDGHLVVIDPVKKLAWEVSKMKNGDINDIHDQGKTGETPQNPTSTTLNVWDLTGAGEGIPFDGARWSARGGRGAGMPAFAGLLRPEELLSGEIHHALASGFMNNRRGDDGGVWFAGPASRSDGRAVGEQFPLEGARLQLDPGLTEDYFRNTLGMDDYAITVVKALQEYGTYITDNTGNFKIWGQLLSNKIDTTYGSANPTPGSSADEWKKLLGADKYGKFLEDMGKIPLDSFRVLDPGTLYKANMPVAVRPTARTMSGTYNSVQQVVLETPTLGARVYYTTDGSTPTEASHLYSAPIAVSQSTVIKAVAVKDGMQNSNISEFRYELTGVVIPPVVQPPLSSDSPETGTPSVPTDSEKKLVSEAALKSGKDGKVTVELTNGRGQVLLPSQAGEILGHNQLEIHVGAAASLTIPNAVLQSLGNLAPAADRKELQISFQAQPVSAEKIKELLGKQESKHVSIQAASEIFEFSLTIHTKDGKDLGLAHFDQPVAVSFQVKPGVDQKLVGLYFLADNGGLEYIPGKLKDNVITVELRHFSKYALLEYHKQYADVPDSFWAAKVIKELSAKHIIAGQTEETFAPLAPVTRAEFAVLLASALQLPKLETDTLFTDVAPSQWYAAEIAAASKAGLVEGVSAASFTPDATITREQMAAMLVRAHRIAKLPSAQTKPAADFADSADISEWAQAEVDAAVQLGLIHGRADGQFAPKAVLNRAESAQAIYNLLSLQ